MTSTYNFPSKSFNDELISHETGLEAKSLLNKYQHQMDESFRDGIDVNQLISARSDMIDLLFYHIWQREELDKIKACLVAVGGYGRGELHPKSDIDFLIILAEKPNTEVEKKISRLVTFLWDSGLDVGHSVRTLDDCESYAKNDLTIFTNLLESRFITGDQSLNESLKKIISISRMWSPRDFFLAKCEEQKNRYKQTQSSTYNLEPNVKNSPGGLRDVQNIIWIAKRHFGQGNIRELATNGFLTKIEAENFLKGINFLWKVRYALHMLANRYEDRLLFDYQIKVASFFGFSDDDSNLAVEKFMQEYYRVGNTLSELNDVLIQHFDQVWMQENKKEEYISINENFCVRNGYIDVTRDDIFEATPHSLIEIFLLMAENSYILGVSASTIRLMRLHRDKIDDDFRNNPVVNELFLSLLKSKGDVPLQLKRMARHGILGAYIPAFSDIIGKMQYDLFHMYTVDIHTLEVIQNIFRFANESSEFDYLLSAKIISGDIKIELLYLAALFHDIAKGRGGSHSELGAKDAKIFCKQHGLSDQNIKLVSWLVKNHLLMSTVSQKQDLSDPNVIRHFAIETGGRSNLDYLYILTVADINGTNPELWNAWRSTLLRQLYVESTRALRRGLENTLDKDEIILEKKNQALRKLNENGVDVEKVKKQWTERVDEYFIRESVDDLVMHAENIISHIDSDKPLILIKKSSVFAETSVTQITIYSKLIENRFSFMALALEELNLSIYDARLLIAGGGFVLDTFYVVDVDNHDIDDDSKRIDIIKKKIFQVMTKPNVRWLSSDRRTSRRMKNFDLPTQTSFSNDYTPGLSVLEVIAPDRPGLLSIIGKIFFENKIRLHNAKISTMGERVEDVFFITDREDRVITDPTKINIIENQIKSELDEHTQQS